MQKYIRVSLLPLSGKGIFWGIAALWIFAGNPPAFAQVIGARERCLDRGECDAASSKNTEEKSELKDKAAAESEPDYFAEPQDDVDFFRGAGAGSYKSAYGADKPSPPVADEDYLVREKERGMGILGGGIALGIIAFPVLFTSTLWSAAGKFEDSWKWLLPSGIGGASSIAFCIIGHNLIESANVGFGRIGKGCKSKMCIEQVEILADEPTPCFDDLPNNTREKIHPSGLKVGVSF